MDTIKIDSNTFNAWTIPTKNVSMMLINAANGTLACGYISIEAADKFGDPVAIVRGVSSYDDMLNAKVAAVSKAAAALGITTDHTGQQALLLMS